MRSRIDSRHSGIELLKVIAVALIVLSHVCQSVGQFPSELPEYAGLLIDSSQVTTNFNYLLIGFFRYFGPLGNNIFLVCSFWFLVESK